MPPAGPALELRGIVKRFPGVLANDRVDLRVERGEIRALLGENGAGKTTLMRVLYGLYPPDEGEILLGGKRQSFRSPADAIRAGLGMVHQHFMLFPSLTVTENVIYGREPRRWGLVDLATAEERVRDLAERHGLAIDPRARVDDLPAGLKQRVEILKTLYRNSRVLILDEPTAVLTPQERQALFTILRGLADGGQTILLITHKLQEVMDLADHATVLRQGRVVATRPVAETSPRELSRLMVGRDAVAPPTKEPVEPGAPLLQVKSLSLRDATGRHRVDDVSLTVRSGEIVGIGGVSGNGQSELAAALAGLQPVASGRIHLGNHDLTHASVAERRRAGLAYIPEDTGGVGLALDGSIRDNLLLRAAPGGYRLPSSSKRDAEARRLGERFALAAVSTRQPAGSLSGGNRQKIVVARELSQEPKLLIAEQPTQGIDIGAAEGIQRDLLAARDSGCAVLLICADATELLALADRILVMFEGRVHEVEAATANEELLGLLAAGGVVGQQA